MIRTQTSLWLALFASLFVASCGSSSEEPADNPGDQTDPPAAEEEAAAPANPEAVAAARQRFDTLCASCHGADGTGNTPTAAALDPKPRNYTSTEWQESTTDAQISEIIVKGGAAVGKSMLMPANPDLADKPEVVAELVKIIRGFHK